MIFNKANQARNHSYSPYSKAKVGAALKTANGEYFSGCNIENSSYGGTTCAEQVAILKAVSEGHQEITEICIVTDATPPWPPCGICRQMMSEFMTPEGVIHLANTQGIQMTLKLKDLLPHAFTAGHLTKKN